MHLPLNTMSISQPSEKDSRAHATYERGNAAYIYAYLWGCRALERGVNLCLRRGSVVNAADDSVMAFYANSPNDFSEMKKASRYKRKNSAYRVEGIMDSLNFSQLYRIKGIVE